MYPSMETIKAQARILQNFVILEENKKMSLGAAFECIAQMWGFQTWNAFCSKLKNKEIK